MNNMINYHPEEIVILIVDDVQQNLQLLTHILDKEGYQCSLASSGKEALEMLNMLTPDLILLDLMMPQMNGLEVCERVKSNPDNKEIPIIFLTASLEEKHLVKAFEVGANDYVTKPFKKAELLARISTQLSLSQHIKHFREMNSQLKQKNLELKDVNDELELYNDMVSHDIKNPLTVIKSTAQILEHQYQKVLDNQALNFLQDIDLLSNRIENLVDNMKTLSSIKPDKMNIQSVNLSLIVIEILSELQFDYPDEKVKTTIADEIVVQGDENLFWILLKNLLSNAWKFSKNDHGKEREIEFGVIKAQQLETPNKPKSIKKDDLIYFVKDNGIGFEVENSEIIFNFFKRLHNQDEYEGSGIGLGIVKRIINYHGGDIWCESKPNQETTFYFNLNSSSS